MEDLALRSQGTKSLRDSPLKRAPYVLDRSRHIEDAVPPITATDSCVVAFVQALLLNWCAGRDMSARRGPLVVGLELQAELVVEDPQIAVAAAQYRRGHDCLGRATQKRQISQCAQNAI